MPPLFRTTIVPSRFLTLARPFTTIPPLAKEGVNTLSTEPGSDQKRMGSNPQANQPDSINKNVRRDTPNTDHQSSASKEEHNVGDEHPAKQPDYQAEPSRKTGVGGDEEVKGGKEGLGEVGKSPVGGYS